MAKATESKLNIKPLEDRVLVKPAEAETKTKSGIYLPEGAKEKPLQGKVVAVGAGKLADDGSRTPITVKNGDTVVYGKYSGTEIEVSGEKLLLLRESELLAVLEG